ncbi:MAG: hypothetical protein R2772_06595 [Chitinophagales bacterium]
MNLTELKKNVWLYFSKASFIGIVVVYFLALFLTTSISDESTSGNIYAISIGFFIVITSIWGSFSLSNALLSELRNRTWVYQKMSAISALDMSFGKLFGPTAMHWLVGAIFLSIATLASFSSRDHSLLSLFHLFLGTLFLHASSLVLSLLVVRQKQDSPDTTNLSGRPFLLIAFFLILKAIASSFKTDLNDFTWYGLAINSDFFETLSLLVFAIWAILGVYRNMREELQYQNLPNYWVAFNVFVVFYFSGLVFKEVHEGVYTVFNGLFAFAFAMHVLLTVLTLFLEPINFMDYLQFFKNWGKKSWEKIYASMPLWVFSLAFSFALCLVLSLQMLVDKSLNLGEEESYSFLYPLVAFMFLLKSLLVNLFLHLKQTKKANFVWFLYLALWYGLLPATIGGLFSAYGLFLFYPANVILSGSASVFYVLFMLWLIRKELKNGEASELIKSA